MGDKEGLGLIALTGYLAVMEITVKPLPYVNALQRREIHSVELLVLHCTELPDLQTAREYGEVVHYADSGTGNAGHYYVDRDGHCEQWVPVERTAHHVRGHNAESVGIELVNRGRWPDWYHLAHQKPDEEYPEMQIAQLVALIKHLRSRLPNLQRMAGHSDLDRQQIPAADQPTALIQRKIDPGPLFPWDDVVERSGLSRWIP